uniref:CortBP2 domain-containing protein n=1 Tax=Globodera pallida TaxID=36090 RepID=A0A183BQU7_GLOPA
MVFFIVDLFLTEGINTIFHISLALLQDSKKELLQSDFEGVLKFFRVNLPRKYRTEANAKDLIHSAVMLKISHKRLAKYEKEWHEMKRREIESQDPLERLERENCRLKEQIMRLERENDDLAHELVTSKIELRHKLDTTEDQLETAVSQMAKKNRECEEVAERERQLREQSEQVKQRCRQEVARLEEELHRAQGVNAEYKRICTELGLTVDEQKRKLNEQRKSVKIRTASCECCTEALNELWADSPAPSSSSSTNGGAGGASPLPTRRPASAMANNGCGGSEHSGTNSPIQNGSRSSALHVMELVERLEEKEQHIRQVELELAQTKLALVESQCQNQDLTHQMSTSMHQQLQNNGVDHSATDTRPAWLKKTLSSIKEAQSALSSASSSHQRTASNASVASTYTDHSTK